jgi:hypothetical protein
MIKYTPKQSILAEMERSNKSARPWETNYQTMLQILQRYRIPTNHILATILQTRYPEVSVYSKTKLNQIPVNGYMFPVEMFEEVQL